MSGLPTAAPYAAPADAYPPDIWDGWSHSRHTCWLRAAGRSGRRAQEDSALDVYIVTLRAVHIVCAAFWVGASLSFALFIEPVAHQLGPSAGPFMQELTERRRFPVVIAVVSVLAIVAGGLLYWRDSSGLEWDWISTRTGVVFTVGALAAVAAWLVGFLVLRPGIERAGALSAAAPTDEAVGEELAQLGRRLRTASLANASLIVAAALAMAIARYV